MIEDKETYYLDLKNEDMVVSNLINKYKLIFNKPNKNVENSYEVLLEFISTLYEKELIIPDDIKEQIELNMNFRIYLLDSIEKKLNNILYDKQTFFFKEIVISINLLSFGKDYHIFENYSNYNLDNLQLLFKEYEKRLTEVLEDKTKFELCFNQYLLLINAINELCIINSIDIQRKKSINKILEIVTESVNISKFKFNLCEEKINLLNNILGKLLFFYAHIPYIDTTNKSLKYTIEEFTFHFEKIIDGFTLTTDSQIENKDDYSYFYKIYLNSLSILLLNLIYKISYYYKNEEFSFNLFRHILDLYEEAIEHKKVVRFDNIDDFKEDLLTNFTYIYTNDIKKDEVFILKDYLQNSTFNNSNMQLISSIILHSNKIKEDLYEQILIKLLNEEKYPNDYLEFFKLNIIDIIINKFINKKNSELINNYLEEIISYIKENKTASHLISMYSKVYLSLSLYLSYFQNDEYIEKSKKYFYIYVSINGEDLLENEYSIINKQIKINQAKCTLEDFNLASENINKSKLLNIGNKVLKKYIKEKKENQRYFINESLLNIVADIFKKKDLEKESLNNAIQKTISNKIFYGLVILKINGLCEDYKINDMGYETVSIELFDEYSLDFYYSKVYKEVFEYIFENNKKYIIENISNLLTIIK